MGSQLVPPKPTPEIWHHGLPPAREADRARALTASTQAEIWPHGLPPARALTGSTQAGAPEGSTQAAGALSPFREDAPRHGAEEGAPQTSGTPTSHPQLPRSSAHGVCSLHPGTRSVCPTGVGCLYSRWVAATALLSLCLVLYLLNTQSRQQLAPQLLELGQSREQLAPQQQELGQSREQLAPQLQELDRGVIRETGNETSSRDGSSTGVENDQGSGLGLRKVTGNNNKPNRRDNTSRGGNDHQDKGLTNGVPDLGSTPDLSSEPGSQGVPTQYLGTPLGNEGLPPYQGPVGGSSALHLQEPSTSGAHAVPPQAYQDQARSPSAAGEGPAYQGRIPGSRLRTPAEVASVRDSLACVATTGQWVVDPRPRRLAWPPRLSACDVQWMRSRRGVAGRTADSVEQPSQWSVRPGLKYEWAPKGECGEWPRFDPGRFCAAMRRLGGPLMLAGDSISSKMHESIHNLLQLRQERVRDAMQTPGDCRRWEADGTLDRRRRWALCRAVLLCGDSVPILRVRNDRLSLIERPPFKQFHSVGGKMRVKGFALPWLSLIKAWGVKALVLNRGAHFSPTPQFAEELKEALVTVRERHPDLLIIYRSSAPGHARCRSVEKPLTAPQNRSALPYHWGELHEQNVIARRIVESLGGVYLDVEAMNELRADGHVGRRRRKVDCLHHCAPGPMDEWVRLLQTALDKLI